MSIAGEGRVMALDVGDARVGVALSDELRLTSQPHASVDMGKNAAREIADIAASAGVRRVVVGMPYELTGQFGPQAQKVTRFAQKLQKEFHSRPALRSVPFEEWDERLTSRQAEQVLAGSGLKDKDRRKALDRVSAAIILESYLMSKR